MEALKNTIELTDEQLKTLEANEFLRYGQRSIKKHKGAYELHDFMVRMTRYKSIDDLQTDTDGHRFEYDTLSSMSHNKDMYIDCHGVLAYSDEDSVYIKSDNFRINEIIQSYGLLIEAVKRSYVGFDKKPHIERHKQLTDNQGDKVNIAGEHIIIDFSDELTGLKIMRTGEGAVMVFYDSQSAEDFSQKHLTRGIVVPLTTFGNESV